MKLSSTHLSPSDACYLAFLEAHLLVILAAYLLKLNVCIVSNSKFLKAQVFSQIYIFLNYKFAYYLQK